MGTYLGYVENKSDYFNFTPVALIKNENVIKLTDEMKEELLPDSEFRNINFSYDFYHDGDRMYDFFRKGNSLCVFEFTTEELEGNFNSQTNQRNRTGYKVPAVERIKEKKIRQIDSCNIYYIIDKDNVLNLLNSVNVQISHPNIKENDKVFVEWNDYWVGPYEVGYREYDDIYYVQPQVKNNKYTLTGYKKQDLESTIIESHDNRWQILIPKKNSIYDQIDVISDEKLLESFKESIRSTNNNGLVDINDIPTLLHNYKTSLLTGKNLEKNTKENRQKRISDILLSGNDLSHMTKLLGDRICDLLIINQDSPQVNKWLEELIENKPEFFEQLKTTKAISGKIAQLEKERNNLLIEKESLEKEIEHKRSEDENNTRITIEAKKAAMLQVSNEYKEKQNELNEISKKIELASNIVDLQTQKNKLNEEIEELVAHNNYLEKTKHSLDIEFQEIIDKPQEKMIDLAFDGFMASKMLGAASQWEEKEKEGKNEKFLDELKDIPVTNKDRNELINYLCKNIQTVRPTYDRNTIINIAICTTQGFLTVFSGKPGCGKTSICNIYAEVLGLNKIPEYLVKNKGKEQAKRYIPISVEKGWTSKRDFVGYYNPLSKSFDKSNQNIYEALYQLDQEKQKNNAELPYIILLDEANLSPMEYYWSDFMNICDDLNDQSKVNLGENFVFGIPETLHFLATINNDHTTETLSPRLIDRSWVVTLPYSQQLFSSGIINKNIPKDQIEIISWNSLKNAFTPNQDECKFDSESQKMYDAILNKLREKQFFISPRVDQAIKKYWTIASRCFETDDTKIEPDIIALDYAISQRILPRISGSGDEFEEWLNDLKVLCNNNGLIKSAGLIDEMIIRGNQQMNYYQFFN
jgi:MoxR-like ATPase